MWDVQIDRTDLAEKAPIVRSGPVAPLIVPRRAPGGSCASSEDTIVVCGRNQSEQFRLKPLPPPPKTETLLTRPLRWQIAPGVTFGLQRGGGVDLKVETGPGKKSTELPPSAVP